MTKHFLSFKIPNTMFWHDTTDIIDEILNTKPLPTIYVLVAPNMHYGIINEMVVYSLLDVASFSFVEIDGKYQINIEYDVNPVMNYNWAFNEKCTITKLVSNDIIYFNPSIVQVHTMMEYVLTDRRESLLKIRDDTTKQAYQTLQETLKAHDAEYSKLWERCSPKSIKRIVMQEEFEEKETPDTNEIDYLITQFKSREELCKALYKSFKEHIGIEGFTKIFNKWITDKQISIVNTIPTDVLYSCVFKFYIRRKHLDINKSTFIRGLFK